MKWAELSSAGLSSLRGEGRGRDRNKEIPPVSKVMSGTGKIEVERLDIVSTSIITIIISTRHSRLGWVYKI